MLFNSVCLGNFNRIDAAMHLSAPWINRLFPINLQFVKYIKIDTNKLSKINKSKYKNSKQSNTDF